MKNMPVKTARCVEEQRLVYYRSQVNADFWDVHWKKYFSPDMYKNAVRGGFVWFEKPFTEFLSGEGRILEAGCGLGLYVLALLVRIMMLKVLKVELKQ